MESIVMFVLIGMGIFNVLVLVGAWIIFKDLDGLQNQLDFVQTRLAQKGI
jgi:hypothetical protein